MRTSDIARVVVALVADELGRLRGQSIGPQQWSAWGPGTRLDEDDVGVDSLDVLSLVARLNGFFHLHEVGSEDYLVMRRSLGEWTEVVEETLKLRHERLSFQTSGSTGEPKTVVQDVAELAEEIALLDGLAPGGRRIIALVPPHHIYGWLASVGLAAFRDAEVVDLRAGSPSRLKSVLQPGDLVVATPFLWDMALRMGVTFPRGVAGFSAGAALPRVTDEALRTAGLERLVEIYGSSETAGVGWRDCPDSPFQLFPYWAWDAAAQRLQRNRRKVEPPDVLAFEVAGGFRPLGRQDGAVQVGGLNVFPERVRNQLLQHPLVRDCAVRLDVQQPEAQRRLKAFVVLNTDAAPEAAVQALRSWCAEHLSPAERPARFTVGAETPRTETGKAKDWAA